MARTSSDAAIGSRWPPRLVHPLARAMAILPYLRALPGPQIALRSGFQRRAMGCGAPRRGHDASLDAARPHRLGWTHKMDTSVCSPVGVCGYVDRLLESKRPNCLWATGSNILSTGLCMKRCIWEELAAFLLSNPRFLGSSSLTRSHIIRSAHFLPANLC